VDFEGISDRISKVISHLGGVPFSSDDMWFLISLRLKPDMNDYFLEIANSVVSGETVTEETENGTVDPVHWIGIVLQNPKWITEFIRFYGIPCTFANLQIRDLLYCNGETLPYGTTGKNVAIIELITSEWRIEESGGSTYKCGSYKFHSEGYMAYLSYMGDVIMEDWCTTIYNYNIGLMSQYDFVVKSVEGKHGNGWNPVELFKHTSWKKAKLLAESNEVSLISGNYGTPQQENNEESLQEGLSDVFSVRVTAEM